jgi:DNA-directed RNA polymerase subunit RPC12/RpoP
MTIETLKPALYKCTRCGKHTEWDPELGDEILCVDCWDKASEEALNNIFRAGQRRYRLEHKDEVAAGQRRWYQEHKDEVAAGQRRYRLEHKDEVAAGQRRYRLEHKDEVAAGQRRWYQEHKVLRSYMRIL